jgi:signal transduction histidine kinase
LENAILNLILNAGDAMPGGGSVVIRASAIEDGSRVKISLSDTGTGMTPRVLARAFDPFFTTKPPGQGTGLGLATVYGFAKQSGGYAEIESTLGAGTTVSIFLPTAAASR